MYLKYRPPPSSIPKKRQTNSSVSIEIRIAKKFSFPTHLVSIFFDVWRLISVNLGEIFTFVSTPRTRLLKRSISPCGLGHNRITSIEKIATILSNILNYFWSIMVSATGQASDANSRPNDIGIVGLEVYFPSTFVEQSELGMYNRV